MVVQKLVEDQEIDIPWNLTRLSDKDIIPICDAIIRPGGLVGIRMPDRGNQVSRKNIKLALFMLKSASLMTLDMTAAEQC